MPFQSEAQRGWMYVHHPQMAKRWEHETPKGKKLPYHKKRKKAASLIELALFNNFIKAAVLPTRYNASGSVIKEPGESFMAFQARLKQLRMQSSGGNYDQIALGGPSNPRDVTPSGGYTPSPDSPQLPPIQRYASGAIPNQPGQSPVQQQRYIAGVNKQQGLPSYNKYVLSTQSIPKRRPQPAVTQPQIGPQTPPPNAAGAGQPQLRPTQFGGLGKFPRNPMMGGFGGFGKVGSSENKLTTAQAFKAGFLMRCVDAGMTNDQICNYVERILENEKKADIVTPLKTIGSGLGNMAAATLLSIPIGVGALGGVAAAKLTGSDGDVEQLKQQELIDTYNYLAEEAKRRAQAKRRLLGLPHEGVVWQRLDKDEPVELPA